MNILTMHNLDKKGGNIVPVKNANDLCAPSYDKIRRNTYLGTYDSNFDEERGLDYKFVIQQ